MPYHMYDNHKRCSFILFCVKSESSMATRTNKRNGGTRLSASTSTSSRTLKSNTNKPGRRFQQRLAYILRHPTDAAWGWLSSVRTAILLIASITTICLLGIYFVQAPGEALDDPASSHCLAPTKCFPALRFPHSHLRLPPFLYHLL